jgi:hypothetical protein
VRYAHPHELVTDRESSLTGTDDHHVLLRHRPRSISPNSAAFHAKQNRCFSSKAAVTYSMTGLIRGRR